MTHHFGVLIPSTNTTCEIEYSRLPAGLQAHYGRLLTSGAGPFSPSRNEDIDHQSKLLGTAKVEAISLAQIVSPEEKAELAVRSHGITSR